MIGSDFGQRDPGEGPERTEMGKKERTRGCAREGRARTSDSLAAEHSQAMSTNDLDRRSQSTTSMH